MNANKFFLFVLFSAYIAIDMSSALCFQQEKTPPRLELVHADSLFSMGDHIQILDGNVFFKQENAEMKCDSAVRYVATNTVIFIGNVSIIKKNQFLYAQQIDYFQSSDLFVANRDVKLIDSTKVLTCRQLNYWQERNKTLAKYDVVIRDTSRLMTLKGDSVFYNLDDRYARVLIDPVFVKKDSSDSLDLTITGQMIELFDDGDRISVSQDVDIDRGNIEARCDTLIYNRQENLVMLCAEPCVFRQGDLMFGDLTRLHLNGTEIESIDIHNNAFVATLNDTLDALFYDFLLGTDMTITVKESEIDTVFIQGQATSYYHVFEDNRLKGINKVIGDELLIDFDDGQIQMVSIISDPSVCEGAFYPADMTAEATFHSELSKLKARYAKLVTRFD